MKNTQFSTREVPWMKLGKLIDQPVTAKEAATLAKLDFTVSLQEVAWIGFGNEGGLNVNNVIHPIKGRKAVIADDNGDFMGFVSSTKYNALQYSDAFNFMDGINPLYVAAGGLRDRRQGFMVAKFPTIEKVDVFGEDPHQLYVVLRTSHDCSRATEVSVMMLRNRCMNQLTLRSFSKDAVYRWSIKHTSSQVAKLAEAQQSLKNTGAYVKAFGQTAEKLVLTPVNVGSADAILRKVIRKPQGKTPLVDAKYETKIEAIMSLFCEAPEVGYPGTGWGLVNAVSSYHEWYRAGGTPESRFIGALQGETHRVINRTAELLLH